MLAGGYAWMPHTGLDPMVIWQGSAVMAVGFAAIETKGHVDGLKERNGVDRIRRSLAGENEGQEPVFFGREFGETGVRLLYTPATRTLDVVWTFYEVEI